MASYPLAGKVAFVTGAAQGIGFEAARLMHARGASVAMLDLDETRTSEAAARVGERTLALAVDVTDRAAMDAAAAATIERFGGIDVPVANAGIAPPTRPMSVVDDEAFDRVLRVNVDGVWNTVRATLPQVIERRGHAVVIASVYAFLNGAIATPYAMSKAAVEALGRSLRVELAPHGASATVAYFGFIDTAMVQDAMADPIARLTEDALPKFMQKRLHPSAAGQAIVEGVEKRAARVIRPRFWSAYSALRGVVNPMLDTRLVHEDQMHRAVREGERAGRS